MSVKIQRTKLWLAAGVAFVTIVGAGLLMNGPAPSQNHKTRLSAAQLDNTQGLKNAIMLPAQNSTIAGQSTAEVPELGVMFNVPSSLNDLTYKVNTVTLKNGQIATLTMFSTASLAQLDPNCSADTGPLGSLEKVSGEYPSGDPYAALDYGKLVKQFPTYYIAAGSPQGSCSANSSIAVTAKAHSDDLFTAESTTGQIN